MSISRNQLLFRGARFPNRSVSNPKNSSWRRRVSTNRRPWLINLVSFTRPNNLVHSSSNYKRAISSGVLSLSLFFRDCFHYYTRSLLSSSSLMTLLRTVLVSTHGLLVGVPAAKYQNAVRAGLGVRENSGSDMRGQVTWWSFICCPFVATCRLLALGASSWLHGRCSTRRLAMSCTVWPMTVASEDSPRNASVPGHLRVSGLSGLGGRIGTRAYAKCAMIHCLTTTAKQVSK